MDWTEEQDTRLEGESYPSDPRSTCRSYSTGNAKVTSTEFAEHQQPVLSSLELCTRRVGHLRAIHPNHRRQLAPAAHSTLLASGEDDLETNAAVLHSPVEAILNDTPSSLFIS